MDVCSGIFTINTVLRKRREHGLAYWVLFLDLVKAFDWVPRKLLWKILVRFEAPIKLESMVRYRIFIVDSPLTSDF